MAISDSGGCRSLIPVWSRSVWSGSSEEWSRCPERWSRSPGTFSTGRSDAGHHRRQAVSPIWFTGETECQPGDCPWNVPANVMWPSELKWRTGGDLCAASRHITWSSKRGDDFLPWVQGGGCHARALLHSSHSNAAPSKKTLKLGR